MRQNPTMLEIGGCKWQAGPILGIETSCDETSVAIVDGLDVRSNIVSSQAELHRKWGGVVPEAAARAHVEAILPVLRESLETASLKLSEIAGIAVTNRPGLVGALSVGVTAAKGLAFATGKPFVGVHHLEGHVLSPLLSNSKLPFPQLCLLVSGGHTELVWVASPGDYRIVGQTRDDAAGEAFDKSARLMGLGYPGGWAIQQAAEGGHPRRYPLPVGLAGEGFDFSFSGLKTAVRRLVESEGDNLSIADAAASLQHAIVSALAAKTAAAIQELAPAALTLAGGVAANKPLRHSLQSLAEREGIPFAAPTLELCTDNAAMIAFAGGFRLGAGERADWTLDVHSNSELPASLTALPLS